VTAPLPAVTIRSGTPADAPAIRALYQVVGARAGGIARAPDEVTSEYVEGFITKALERGIIIVAELQGMQGLAGELHAWRTHIRSFAHVLGDLTIAVHPDVQGMGIGRRLFTTLLETVERSMPEILRVELVTQESNTRALRLYESLGFVREGRMERRIRTPLGTGVEADIPMAWFPGIASGAVPSPLTPLPRRSR
jgi:putative acetyltransferase